MKNGIQNQNINQKFSHNKKVHEIHIKFLIKILLEFSAYSSVGDYS